MRHRSANWLRRGSPAGLLLFLMFSPSPGSAQKDPGVRQGPPGAGASLHGLTPVELSLFLEGQQRAIQLESICDDGCADL